MKNKIIKSLVLFCTFLTLLTAACKKAENYYDGLVGTPEIRNDYTKSFQVGSTMVLTGRLNPDKGLVIKVGDAEASYQVLPKVVGGGTQQDPYYIDQVSFTITKEMGVGKDRPVTITSGGKTVSSPAIEIYLPKNLDYQLKFQQHYVLKSGDVTLSCVNGLGNIYLYRKEQGDIAKINSSAAVNTVVLPSAYKDAQGAFTITEFYGGGVNPQENTLYFSALTTDGSADNAANRIYRLCKVDLSNGQLQTINRTLLNKADPLPVVNLKAPLEGQIGNVSLMEVYKIYPDSKGNIFLQPGGHVRIREFLLLYSYATVLIDNQGKVKYLFKCTLEPNVSSTFINEYRTSILTLPGIAIAQLPGQIMPDEKRMYCSTVPESSSASFAPTTIAQYDLATSTLLYTFLKGASSNIKDRNKPTISGSFDNLTAVFTGIGGAPEAQQLFGFMPMPEERLLVYYYQSGIQSSNGAPYQEFPALGVLDMLNKKGERYAPGSLSSNSTDYFTVDDEMLNYDSDGMIYTTVNKRSTILKTVRK